MPLSNGWPPPSPNRNGVVEQGPGLGGGPHRNTPYKTMEMAAPGTRDKIPQTNERAKVPGGTKDLQWLINTDPQNNGKDKKGRRNMQTNRVV